MTYSTIVAAGIDTETPLGNISDMIDDLHMDSQTRHDTTPTASSTATSTPTSSSSSSSFRSYPHDPTSPIHKFYTLQRTHQTLSLNLHLRAHFYSPTRPRPLMSIWDAILKLTSLIDDSDPDTTALPQIEHLLQTAEAIRGAGKPRWMQLAGLIHDLGKIMGPDVGFDGDLVERFMAADCSKPTSGTLEEYTQTSLSNNSNSNPKPLPQWALVGDTFPVGCGFCPTSNILPLTFHHNPDMHSTHLSTLHGIYPPHVGLSNLILSWGHDEYLYLILRDTENQCLLPEEALAMVRYHSFYPWHREGGYKYLMKEGDGDERLREMVGGFSGFDLYSKSETRMDVEGLKPYYIELIDEFFPKKLLRW